MAKIQRRKNVSMSPECFGSLTVAAERFGIPHSQLSERILRRALGLPSVRRPVPGSKGFEWVQGTRVEQHTFAPLPKVKRRRNRPAPGAW